MYKKYRAINFIIRAGEVGRVLREEIVLLMQGRHWEVKKEDKVKIGPLGW